MTTRKSSSQRKPAASGRKARSGRSASGQKGLWVVLLSACVVAVLYPPWRDVWVNFEGFKLHAPVVYGLLWSPPPSVFPSPRTIDDARLAEELVVILGAGGLFFWLRKKGARR